MRERMASRTDRSVFALVIVFGLVAGVLLVSAAFATTAVLSYREHASVSRPADVPVQQAPAAQCHLGPADVQRQ
jgi:hypothetical protein